MWQNLQNFKLQLFAWFILLIPSFSLIETTNCTKLNFEQNTISVQFKYLNGSNRIAEAKQLLSIIDNGKFTMDNEEQIKNKTVNYQSSIVNYTFKDLKKIFGTPSSENPDGSLTYIYDYTNNKTFTIKTNKLTQQCEIMASD